MSKRDYLTLLTSLIMLGGDQIYIRGEERKLSPEETTELNRLRDIAIKKRQGLKEFDIDGIKVLALNKKNAIRKANKIKELTESINKNSLQ
jgi:hypothetical protein